MSSQPNQSLIDGIRCLQYLVSSGRAVGCRELAREMGMNPTRVNRFLMSMASVGLTAQDDQRRYLPGPNILVLAAQAIRGSSVFAEVLPKLDELAPKDVRVALGVLWENRVVYIYHSKPGSIAYQALADSPSWPVHESIIGTVLVADRSDDEIRALCAPHDAAEFLRHVEMARTTGSAIWHRADGRVAMAVPTEGYAAGLAFSGMYNTTPEEEAFRMEQLKALAKAIA
jgi:DNA-binding IclR family transcriptional regulator